MVQIIGGWRNACLPEDGTEGNSFFLSWSSAVAWALMILLAYDYIPGIIYHYRDVMRLCEGQLTINIDTK